MTNISNTVAVVENVRLSYVNLFTPRAGVQGQEAKYSTTILLPKSDLQSKQRLDAAIQAAAQRGLEKIWGGVMPPVLSNPIHDGDGVKQDGTPFGEECKGHWVFTASAKADNPVEIVDQNVQPIMNQAEIYSGVYANVAINVYPYQHSGKKGVGFGLATVQKVRDGEVLGGAPVKASSVFTAVQGANPLPNPNVQQVQPQQNVYGQQSANNYAQPQQNVYGQQSANNYAQPQQNVYGQNQAPQQIDPITGQPLM